MNANKNFDEFGSILVSKKSDGLTLDTTTKDRLAILVSPAGNTGSIRASSNLKTFSNSKKGVKIPDRLVLQVSRCASVFDGLCEVLNTLLEHTAILKHVVQLDISFVSSVNNKGNTSADDAKAIAEELTRLLPNVTSYRCALGVENSFTMLAFASSIADRYAAQLSCLVCHWKVLHNMRKLAERLMSLERLSIGGDSGTDVLYKGSISLPKLNHIAAIICPYTLSLLLSIEKAECINKAILSISDVLLFEITDFTLDEAAKEKLGTYCTNDGNEFDMIMFSNVILAQDGIAREATAYINKELVHEDVDWIYWNSVTKLVVTACIGFADILIILHHSPNIAIVEARKVIHVFEKETQELLEILDNSGAAGDKEIYDLATPAANYDGELPANLCKMVARKTVDGKTVDGLRKWAYWYNDWLVSSGINDIYEMHSGKMELEGVEYHFAKQSNQETKDA